MFFICAFHCVYSQENEKKAVELNTVTVKGNRNPLKETAKGVVLDISKLPDAKLLTLSEILSSIPGIEVKDNGNISYMGKSLTLLRDGVNVAGFASQLMNSLKGANIGSNYTKIELNLYNLKTEGPTLSFVATKYDEGYFGNIMSNAGSNSAMAMGSASLSKKNYLLNLNASGNLQYSPSSTNRSETYFSQTQLKENRDAYMSGTNLQAYRFSLSNSFFINSQNTFNVSGTYAFSGFNYRTNTFTQQYQNNVLINSTITSLSSKTPIAKSPDFSVKLSYVYKPKASEVVNQRFDMALEYDNAKNLDESYANSQTLNNKFLPYSNYVSNNAKKNVNLFGLLGYEYNHSELGDFEFMARYFSRKSNELYDFIYETDASGNIDRLLQANTITYNYGALLAAWSKNFEKLSVRTVIKQDFSNDYIANLSGRDKFNFSTFSPYLSLQKSLTNGNIRFEAKFSQSRPTLNSLSSVIHYGAQFNQNNVVTIGNPYLKPSKTLYFSGVYNINIKDVNVIITGIYQHETDAISSFLTSDTNNVQIRTYRNLAVKDEFNSDVSVNFYLFPRCTLQLFTKNGFGEFRIKDEETQNTYSWENGFKLNFTPVPNIRLGTNVGIRGGTNFQSKSKAQINSSLSASYLKNKASFTFSVINFHQPYFNTYNWIYGEGYQSYVESRSRRLIASLTFGYSFGKVTKRSTVMGKDIKKDDM
ncbi:outer membrane beta-barrel protein [Pedobacter sp. MW01-1-1]|uniref:outer membrane beta-barrel protein n=1 Tax=Pedobacter sp. MW01-1-1 TaxID=3383027 RepID=UPI003FEF2CC4